MTSRTATVALPLAALLGALLLGGCTATSDDDGSFALPSTDEVQCQEHQTERPGTAYTGGDEGDTAKVFSLLRYWTANGEKPYCDGEPPTEVDTAWKDLVDRLQSGEPAPVEPAPSQTT